MNETADWNRFVERLREKRMRRKAKGFSNHIIEVQKCGYCQRPLGNAPVDFIDDKPYHPCCVKAAKMARASRAKWPRRGFVIHPNPCPEGKTPVCVTHFIDGVERRIDVLRYDGTKNCQPIEELVIMLDYPEDFDYHSPAEVLVGLNGLVSKWRDIAKEVGIPFHVDQYLLQVLDLVAIQKGNTVELQREPEINNVSNNG